MTDGKNSTAYLTPFIVEPLSQPHVQSFIFLHGRGSNGPKFGNTLLSTPISISKLSELSAVSNRDETNNIITLQTIFPHARFIFPTASLRRATIYKRSLIHQWFDNWHLDEINQHTELMCEGLRGSCATIQLLVEGEVAIVGSKNVVLGGLSQGCATVLIETLLGHGSNGKNKLDVAAVVGMCGWLPFADEMASMMEDIDAANPFEEDAEGQGNETLQNQALSYLYDQLDLEAPTMLDNCERSTYPPIFLGHGVKDDRVKVTLGRTAVKLLTSFGINVQAQEYNELGHWYSSKMLADVVLFLKEQMSQKT